MCQELIEINLGVFSQEYRLERNQILGIFTNAKCTRKSWLSSPVHDAYNIVRVKDFTSCFSRSAIARTFFVQSIKMGRRNRLCWPSQNTIDYIPIQFLSVDEHNDSYQTDA